MFSSLTKITDILHKIKKKGGGAEAWFASRMLQNPDFALLFQKCPKFR